MADWFDEQVAGVNQAGQQQGAMPSLGGMQGLAGGSSAPSQMGMQQVATAPDGVPVFGSGGKFYTQNADGSMTEQFQGAKPDWLTQATSGGQPAQSSGDPVYDAVLANYKALGKDPTGSGTGATDIAYMVDKIKQTGGLTQQNQDYWFGQNGRISNEIQGKVPPESGAGGTLANPQVPAAGQALQNTASIAPYKAPDPFTPQTITQPGAVTAQQVQGPQALTASTLANPQAFQGVSQEEMQNNPQFQYAQQQAMQQLVNSGAAKGIARGSNQWKALEQQASDLAGQQYQQIYNNKFGEWNAQNANTLNFGNANNASAAQAYGLTNQYQQGAQIANQGANLQAGQFNAGMNFNTQQANAGNAANAYQTNATTGLNAFNANVANAQGQQSLGLGYQQAANSLALGQGQLGLGYANYGLNQQGQNYNQGLSTYNANQGAQQQLFNNNFSLAQLGLAANGQIGSQGANYANQAGNTYEGIGNAQGAGSMAQGQNWGTTLGNIGNYAGQLAMFNQFAPQQQQASSYYDGGTS